MAEQYIQQFGNLAKAGNTLVIPSSLSDVGGLIAMAMNIVKQGNTAPSTIPPPAPPSTPPPLR